MESPVVVVPTQLLLQLIVLVVMIQIQNVATDHLELMLTTLSNLKELYRIKWNFDFIFKKKIVMPF